jgi:nucleoside-diphosphate-sugar epimerase
LEILLMVKVAVTGATGFVGKAVVCELALRGFDVRRVIRSASDACKTADTFAVGEVHGSTDWSEALRGVNVVVHLVACTHLRGKNHDQLAIYRKVNVDGTRHLAEEAAIAGVRRLVFVSSIKVNGERTLNQPFRPSDAPAPLDVYGRTKLEAEEALAVVATRSGMETVVVRPPLIYGPGVQGNFRRLMRLVASGLPLPLGNTKNRRSIVALDNLVDLLVRCIDAPQARDRVLLVSDGEPVSTPDLVRFIASAMGRSPRLFPAPPGILQLLGRLTGWASEVQRLCSSLEVDDGETQQLIAWRPRVSIHEGIDLTVKDFIATSDFASFQLSV